MSTQHATPAAPAGAPFDQSMSHIHAGGYALELRLDHRVGVTGAGGGEALNKEASAGAVHGVRCGVEGHPVNSTTAPL